MAETASWRGWATPVIYADDNVPQLADGYSLALVRLEAAISAGRHDTLLLAGPATVRGYPACVMRLLASCTKHGVAVELLGPPAPRAGRARTSTSPGGHWSPGR